MLHLLFSLLSFSLSFFFFSICSYPLSCCFSFFTSLFVIQFSISQLDLGLSPPAPPQPDCK